MFVMYSRGSFSFLFYSNMSEKHKSPSL